MGNASTPDIYYTYRADPTADARYCVKSGDNRLMAVSAVATFVPCDNPIVEEWRAKLGEKVIQGTSDTPHSYAEERAIAVAAVYARHYNNTLVKELSDKSGQRTKEGHFPN